MFTIPKPRKFGFVDLCFQSTRIMFADDKDNTLYFSRAAATRRHRLGEYAPVGRNARRGEIPGLVPGRITATAIHRSPARLRRAAYNTVDGSVWYSDIQIMPGRLIRMVRGCESSGHLPDRSV